MSIRFGLPHSKELWFALLLGVFSAGTSVVPLARGLYSLAWPMTEGVVLASRSKPGFRISAIDIRYRYNAGGREYTGDRYSFRALLTADRMVGRDVTALVGRYPPGERVQVAVSPTDPSESVIAPGIDVDSLVPFVMGLLFTGAALVKKEKEGEQVGATGPTRAKPRYRMAWTLGLSGLFVCLYSASVLYQGVTSLSWPVADGRILYSHAITGNSAETKLWYEYHVENERFVSSQYRTGGNASPFDDVVEAAAKRYPVGKAVKVYYNPGNPKEALLEPGVWWGNFVGPVIGVMLLGGAWFAKKFAEIMAARRS